MEEKIKKKRGRPRKLKLPEEISNTVKKIIEDHGGKIWVTSKENEGTTMNFVIRKYQEVMYEQDTNH